MDEALLHERARRLLDYHADLHWELQHTCMSMLWFPSSMLLRSTILYYIMMTEYFHTTGGPSTRSLAMRRLYGDLLAVSLCYSLVARLMITPVEFRLRFHIARRAVPHVERTRVLIAGRWTTRIEMRPHVRGQVVRAAQLEVRMPGECEDEFDRIVRRLLEDHRFRGDPGNYDFPFNEET